MKKTLIWGMGRNFDTFLMKSKNMQIVFPLETYEFTDSNPELWGKSFVKGIRIQSPDSIDGIKRYKCVISSRKYYEDIKSTLQIKYDVPIENLISIDEFLRRTIIEYQYSEYGSKKRIDSGVSRTGRIVVYTAILGSYDTLKDPLYVDNDVDYICFTDQKSIKSDIWKIVQVKRNSQISAKMQAEYYKLLPHIFFEKYETSIWVDASLIIKDSIIEFINKYNKNSEILLFPHPERICIYDEAAVCMLEGKGEKEVILQQMTKYYSEGYKPNSGLFCGGVLVRKHNDSKVIQTMELWHKEVTDYSERDQICLPFVLHKMRQDVDLCDLDIFDNQFFVFSNHIGIQ